MHASILALLWGTSIGASTGEVGVHQIPSRSPDTTLTIPVGKSVRYNNIDIAFLKVTRDSRCPTGAMCVWAGNAVIQLGLTADTAPVLPLVLNSGIEPRSGELLGLQLRMLSLKPRPTVRGKLQSATYVVELEVKAASAPKGSND